MPDDLISATEHALIEREITTAALAQVAPVGIMRFDVRGRCNYVNQRWTELTALTVDEAIGDGWFNAVHEDDRAAVREQWEKMCEGGKLYKQEYRLARRDGAERWVLAEGINLRGYNGEALGFIRAVTDITSHRELEAELRAIRQDLEERVRERTAALETEMLERQKLEKEVLEIRDNEQRRFGQDLHDSLGQYLTGILFRVLALQRSLEEAGPENAASAAKIGELVTQAIAQAHDIARGIHPVPLERDGLVSALHDLSKRMCAPECGINCHFECNEPLYVKDNVAATHLYRIAQEAINNAVKHSGASNIVLRLERHQEHGRLIVEDNGRGFATEERAHAGRGLSIMKHRARLSDASLYVHSNFDRGTRVECLFAQPKT